MCVCVCVCVCSELVPDYTTGLFKIEPFKELQRKGEEVYSENLRMNGLTWRLKVYPVSATKNLYLLASYNYCDYLQPNIALCLVLYIIAWLYVAADVDRYTVCVCVYTEWSPRGRWSLPSSVYGAQ